MRLHTVRSGDWRDYRTIRLAALREAPEAFESTHDEEAAMADNAWRQRARSSEGGEHTTIALLGDSSDRWVALWPDTDPARQPTPTSSPCGSTPPPGVAAKVRG